MEEFRKACQKASEAPSNFEEQARNNYKRNYEAAFGAEMDRIPPVIEHLLRQISYICLNGGAISIGGDVANNNLDICVVYNGGTFTYGVSREAFYRNPHEVVISCQEILDKIINTPKKEAPRIQFSGPDGTTFEMEGAHFDGEKFGPEMKFYNYES